MRNLFAGLLLFVLLVTVLLPLAVARGCASRPPRPLSPGLAPDAVGPTVNLYCVGDDELVQLGLEEYVAGVVAAEMPATFHVEALKAGAVAARTYALRRLRSLGGAGCDRHPLADLCDDPAHHQAYASPADLWQRWGFFAYYRLWGRVARAVTETQGMILVHDGRPIDAVYHSTCGGHTEAAEDAWGQPVPYLVAVPCDWDRHSPRYRTEVRLSSSELAACLGMAPDGIEVVSRTETGRVRTVLAGGQLVEGADLRRRLGLPAAWFEIAAEGSNYRFVVHGFGHGVGLCQYGADGLGRTGAEFTDILFHYYPGVELVWLDQLD